MDTTYVTIMLVVFLVLAGLTIDIGYMYVSEEDLHHSAEIAALAGAQSIKDRILFQAQNDPEKIPAAAADTVQTVARNAAVDTVTGQHSAAALIALDNNNGNALTENNDLTVGFWNISSRSYTPGGTPVNAMQVRTKRTAESSSVGMGSLGSFLAKITGTESFGLTPVAVAALPAGSRSNIAICSAALEPSCRYPKICSVPERRMSRAPWDPKKDPPATDRYLYTSLLNQVSASTTMSDLVCQEMPTQEVCGKAVYASTGTSDALLRDLKAMMYNPKIDRSNKEYDKNGKLLGWWVVVPALECGALKPADAFERRTVTRYALVRISRICAGGAPGCGAAEAGSDLPALSCGTGQDGLYLDRISWVDCAGKDKLLLPGLHPVLVHGDNKAPVPSQTPQTPPPA